MKVRILNPNKKEAIPWRTSKPCESCAAATKRRWKPLWCATRPTSRRPLGRRGCGGAVRQRVLHALGEGREPANRPAPEEEVILVAGDDLEADVLQREQDRFIREAMLAMGQSDREIFLRHYYYNQKCKEIAAVLDKFVYLRKKAGHRSVPGLFLCLNSSQFRLRSPGPFRCNGAPAPASYP